MKKIILPMLLALAFSFGLNALKPEAPVIADAAEAPGNYAMQDIADDSTGMTDATEVEYEKEYNINITYDIDVNININVMPPPRPMPFPLPAPDTGTDDKTDNNGIQLRSLTPGTTDTDNDTRDEDRRRPRHGKRNRGDREVPEEITGEQETESETPNYSIVDENSARIKLDPDGPRPQPKKPCCK